MNSCPRRHTETGSDRRDDTSIGHLDRLLGQFMQKWIGAERILDHRCRGTGERQAHARAEGERRAPAVRCELQLVRLGERGDPPTFGRAAADRQIGLQHVDGVDLDQVAEVESGELALPAAIAILVEDRTAAAPRRSSALTGSSNHFTPNGSTPAAKRFASDALNVPCASTIKPMLRPERSACRLDPGDAGINVAVHHPDAHLDGREATGT